MDFEINNDIIDEALSFYEIQEQFYKDKCYECINNINKDTILKSKASEIYHILYSDNTNKIEMLWKEKNLFDLFGCKCHSYITSILLLLGYKFHKINIKKYNLDETQIFLHKKRVRESLLNDIIFRNYNGIRISQMLWGTYFINLKIIEVGRLQYQIINFNPLNESENKICIRIHIPAGEKLEITKVQDSIKNSEKEIKKYFNLENVDYYCSSWLLSKQVNEIIDKDSNIAKFYNLFNILQEEDGTDDILNFVYNLQDCDDYTKLPENTSLQIKIKELLVNGKKINIGLGILK